MSAPDPWEVFGQRAAEFVDYARGVAHDPAPPAAGLCTACGGIEVVLLEATGARDLSAIGEAVDYPTGYGCELCS